MDAETNRLSIRETEQQKIRTALEHVRNLSPTQLAQERNARCPFCMRLLVPVERMFQPTGRLGDLLGARRMLIWPDRCGCPDEAQAETDTAEQATRMTETRAAAEYRARLARAGLEGKLERYTFESFCDREDWPEAATIRARVLTYAHKVVNGTIGRQPWLILHGGYGLGKSHLAGAVIRRAVDSGMRDSFFRVWGRYLARLQATWNRGQSSMLSDDYGADSEAEIIAELTRGRVVVIDDLDKRDATPWALRVLFDAVNTRYNADAPTILTFNHDISDRALTDYIGAAVLDRILEQAFDVIEFDGPSYRINMPTLVTGNLDDLTCAMQTG